MLRVEAAQILARSGELQNLLINAGIDPDRPPREVPAAVRRQILEALLEHPGASKALKNALGKPVSKERPVVPSGAGAGPDRSRKPPGTRTIPPADCGCLRSTPRSECAWTRSRSTRPRCEVPWEPDLQPGPVGEYLEVVDVDPSSNACYAPVDLNHPHLLASDGLDPAEGVPQFHQQMVYAVAMTTIGRFEQALGRTALWAPYMPLPKKARVSARTMCSASAFIRTPCERPNAFYSPPKKSLLFGYFQARR